MTKVLSANESGPRMLFGKVYCWEIQDGRLTLLRGPGTTAVNTACVGCFICGDPDNHGDVPHSEATGDGLTRYDTTGPAVPVSLFEEPTWN